MTELGGRCAILKATFYSNFQRKIIEIAAYVVLGNLGADSNQAFWSQVRGVVDNGAFLGRP